MEPFITFVDLSKPFDTIKGDFLWDFPGKFGWLPTFRSIFCQFRAKVVELLDDKNLSLQCKNRSLVM